MTDSCVNDGQPQSVVLDCQWRTATYRSVGLSMTDSHTYRSVGLLMADSHRPRCWTVNGGQPQTAVLDC